MRSKLVSFVLSIAVAVPAVVSAQTTNGVEEKPRVFVTDSQSWEMTGGGGGSSSGFGGASRGGARPQTAEIIKTFGERCPQVTINNQKEKADYIVLLDHEGGKGVLRRDNKVAVFNKNGDSIVSHSTASLGNAVKDACEAIGKDWPQSAAKLREPEPKIVSVAAPAAVGPVAGVHQIAMTSMPVGAEIEVDGAFVGNTPSTVEVAPGEHEIAIKKAGYQTWQRKMRITGGNVNVLAELEKK